MKKFTNLMCTALILGSIFISKNVAAQMPGSLVPIFLLKTATGYWGDNEEPKVVAIIDTDGDGIEDAKDECPTVRGTKENNGCPLSKEEREIIRKASGNIYFETGSATIKQESYESLKTLAGLLNKHPEIKTTVEGHTDNTGDAAKNLELSKKRAEAVMKYLVENGESLEHIDSQGYGITRPIATNDTEEGRAKNRRVEIVVTLLETAK